MIHDLEITMDIGFYKSHSIHHLYQHNGRFCKAVWNGHNEYNRTRFEFVNYHKNALCYNVFNIGRYSTMVEYPTKNTI